MTSAPRLYVCTYCYTPLPEFPRIKCVICLDFTLCPDCFEAKLELAGHLASHPVRIILEGAVTPLPAEGHLDRLWCREDHLLLLEALLSAGLGSWSRIASTMGRPPESAEIVELMFELMHCRQDPQSPKWLSPINCCPTHHHRTPTEFPPDMQIGFKHKSQKNEKQKQLLYSFARTEFLEECPLEKAEDPVRSILEAFTSAKRRSGFTIMADAVDAAIREFGRDPTVVTVEQLLAESATAQAAAAATDKHPLEGLAMDLPLSAALFAVGSYLRHLDGRRERQTFLTNWGMLRWPDYVEACRRVPLEERAEADRLRAMARFCGSRAAFNAFVAERVAVERLRSEIDKAKERARAAVAAAAKSGARGTSAAAPVALPPPSGTGRDARREAAADAVARQDGGAYLNATEIDACAVGKVSPSMMIAGKVAAALGLSACGLGYPTPSAVGGGKRMRGDTARSGARR